MLESSGIPKLLWLPVALPIVIFGFSVLLCSFPLRKEEYKISSVVFLNSLVDAVAGCFHFCFLFRVPNPGDFRSAFSSS